MPFLIVQAHTQNDRCLHHHVDGSMQERIYSSVLAMELCLSCTNPSMFMSNLQLI